MNPRYAGNHGPFSLFSRNHFKSSEFIWLTRVKWKKWTNFIGFWTKFDIARLNENSTALFCTYNFCWGTEYRERKINFKRLQCFRREREELLKSRTRCRINLLIVSTETVFTNLKMRHVFGQQQELLMPEYWKKLSNDKETLGNVSSEPHVFLCMCCWLFLKGASVLSFDQNILDAELWIENYRFPSGLTSGEVFQQLSKGDYFYGTALQGQVLCWGIKVDFVNLLFCFCESESDVLKFGQKLNLAF